MSTFDDDSDAFVKRGKYNEMPFKLAEVLCGICRLLGIDFVVVLRPEEGDQPFVVISGWENPGEMLPMLEDVMDQVRKANTEGVKGAPSQ